MENDDRTLVRAKVIRTGREAAGMRSQDLAEAVGRSRDVISRLESGGENTPNLSAELRTALADALGISEIAFARRDDISQFLRGRIALHFSSFENVTEVLECIYTDVRRVRPCVECLSLYYRRRIGNPLRDIDAVDSARLGGVTRQTTGENVDRRKAQAQDLPALPRPITGPTDDLGAVLNDGRRIGFRILDGSLLIGLSEPLVLGDGSVDGDVRAFALHIADQIEMCLQQRLGNRSDYGDSAGMRGEIARLWATIQSMQAGDVNEIG